LNRRAHFGQRWQLKFILPLVFIHVCTLQFARAANKIQYLTRIDDGNIFCSGQESVYFVWERRHYDSMTPINCVTSFDDLSALKFEFIRRLRSVFENVLLRNCSKLKSNFLLPAGRIQIEYLILLKRFFYIAHCILLIVCARGIFLLNLI